MTTLTDTTREIVETFSERPDFFLAGCKGFMGWVKTYGEKVKRLSEERTWPPADGYMTALDTDHYCLKSTCHGEWRSVNLCHPCGSFGLDANLVTPYVPVKTAGDGRHAIEYMTEDQVWAHDCVILWQVYVRHARLTPAIPGRGCLYDALVKIYCDFDLKRFLLDLRAVLDSPAGPALVADAWRRMRDRLPKKLSRHSHSPDFRFVNWFGTPYSFTAAQAACVEVWWRCWEISCPEIGDATVLEEASYETRRISDLFKKHAAWGTMIVEGSTKGTHCLNQPDTSI